MKSISNSDDYLFSIIIAVYNVEDYIAEAIESVINQSLDFEKNVQLILVDDGSADNSKEIALKYQEKYPNNILILSKENNGQASARNLGLNYATGKYLNFLDSDDKLSLNTLEEVNNFFSKNYDKIDIVTVPIYNFERIESDHRLNYKFEKQGIIDLNQYPHFILFSASASFFKREIFNFKFNTDVLMLEDGLVVNKIFLEKMKYGVVNKCVYYYRQRIIRTSTVDKMRVNKKYYTHRFKNIFLDLIKYSISKKGFVPKFIKYAILYDLQWTLNTPTFEDIFDDADEKREFWQVFKEVLQYIDNDIILHFNVKGYSASKKQFLIYVKYCDEFKVIEQKDNVLLRVSEKYNIDDLKKHNVYIDFINLDNGNVLNIGGAVSSHFYQDSFDIIATLTDENGNKKEYLSAYFDYSTSRPSKSNLDIPWDFVNNFDLKIPLNNLNQCKIAFNILYHGLKEKIHVDVGVKFQKFANLSEISHYSVKDNKIILFKDNSLHIMPYSYKKMLKYELECLSSINKSDDKYESNFLSIFFYRFLFLLLFPFMKNKNIWLFLDRKDFADDNSKHLFKYSVSQKDDIKKYFILNKSSEDFNKMKEIDRNIVGFNSIKHKLLYLFANKLIISYVNEDFINPFLDDRMAVSGLINSKRCFFPHGITKEDVSKYINKYKRNLALFATTSDIEKNAILNGAYNFSEDDIPILGLPRHDGLTKKEDNKQILFMPSWRIDLKNKSSKYIVNSDYFKRLNSLFNNEKLINYADEKGYKLIFKPHPEIREFVDLFDSENIIISTDETYQELLNPSSMLITDYSGTFFDFGYLKKPIIYYQGDEDYHYQEGYWNYETMGFGDVIKDEIILVDRIIEYIENGCIMEEKFKQRVDNFFKFNDNKNCKRGYDWLCKH